VKYTPNVTVKANLNLVEVWSPAIKAWWAQVTEIPEDNKTIVFNKGTEKGLNTKIPSGGQDLPISIAGARLLWKKAQKKERKKKISETINKIIPQRRPNSTMAECSPWKAPSYEISRHHWAITIRMMIRPININLLE